MTAPARHIRGMNEPLDVVIAGAGVGALETALALQDLAGDRVAITLVGPDPYLHYRPLAVHSPFDGRPVRRFSLGAIAADRGWTVLRDTVTSVKPEDRVVATEQSGPRPYGVLVIAMGARPEVPLADAVPFRGPQDVTAFGRVLADVGRGDVRNLAFVVPPGVAWSLPAYELALQTAVFAAERAPGTRVTLFTRERRPLSAFGAAASDAVGRRLEAAGVEFRPDATPSEAEGHDRVVCLPVLRGPYLPGLPCDPDGFLEVDEYGRLPAEPSIYAVGDVAARPHKQGGLAAEQADAVASTLAALAGAGTVPLAYLPVLRGRLVTGGPPLYLLHDPHTGESLASEQPLWEPPHKIFGLRLAPYLEANPDLALGATTAELA